MPAGLDFYNSVRKSQGLDAVSFGGGSPSGSGTRVSAGASFLQNVQAGTYKQAEQKDFSSTPIKISEPVKVEKPWHQSLFHSLGRLKNVFAIGAEDMPANLRTGAGVIISYQKQMNKDIESIPGGKAIKDTVLSLGDPTRLVRQHVQDTLDSLGKVGTPGFKQARDVRQAFDKSIDFQAENLKITGLEKKRKVEEKYQKYLQENGQPEGFMWLAEQVARSTPSFITSFGLGVAAGVLTKNPLLGMAIGFPQSFAEATGQAYYDAKKYGVSDRRAEDVAILTGSGIGLLEMLPIGEALTRSPVGSQLKRLIANNFVRETISQGVVEGSTESIQQILDNALKRTYNENQQLFEGVPESFVVGGVMGTGAGALSSYLETSVIDNEVIAQANEQVKEAVEKKPENRSVEEQAIVDTLLTNTYSPSQAAQVVVSNDLSGTDLGRDILKASAQAQQSNQYVRVKGSETEDSIEIDLVDQPDVDDLIAQLSSEMNSKLQDITDRIQQLIYTGQDTEAKALYDEMAAEVDNLPPYEQLEIEAQQAAQEAEGSIDERYIDSPIVNEFAEVIRKAVKVYNLTKANGRDDIATITRKVPGLDEGIQALREVGIEVETMDQLADIARRLPTKASEKKADAAVKKQKEQAQQKTQRPKTVAEKEYEKYKSRPEKEIVKDSSQYKGISPENIVHFNQGSNGRVTLIVSSANKELIEAGAMFDRLIKGRKRAGESFADRVKYIAAKRELSEDAARKLIIDTHREFKALAKENALRDDEVILNTIEKPDVKEEVKKEAKTETIQENTSDEFTKASGFKKKGQNSENTASTSGDNRVKTEEMLKKEARKYETAEEFIKNKLGAEIKYIAKGDDLIGNVFTIDTSKNKITLSIKETSEEIMLGNIKSINKGTGEGTKIVNLLKEYSDSTGKNLRISGVVNSAESYWNKFPWLEQTADRYGTAFIYVPQKTEKVQSEQTTFTPPENASDAVGSELRDSQKPVGTGKKRKSEAYRKVYERLAEETREDVSYNKLNLQQDAERAADFIAKDKVAALRVAFGLQEPPAGMTETAISIALADKAGRDGNYQLQSQLESSRSLRQTRRGQEIVSERGRFNDESPYRYIRELLDRRLKSVGKTYKGEILESFRRESSKKIEAAKTKAIQKIDIEKKKLRKKMQRDQVKIKMAQDIINALTC